MMKGIENLKSDCAPQEICKPELFSQSCERVIMKKKTAIKEIEPDKIRAADILDCGYRALESCRISRERFMTVPVISALFLSCMSAVLAEKLNFTQRFQRRFLPQLQPPGEMNNVDPWRTSKLSSSLPTARLRDIFFLSEDDYSNNDVEDVSSNDEGLPEIRRDDRNSLSSTEYRSLCQTKTQTIQLTDDQHEYQPPHFHEVYCKSYSFAERVQALARPAQQMCAHPSFHCVQRSKTLFMVRRRWDSDCWEPFSRQVASGCECMWPVTTLGDITGHY